MKEQQDKFEITAQPQNAGQARARIRQAAERNGFDKPSLDDLEIAVGEAVTNAILYGSPGATSRIAVSCYYTPADQMFHVEVRDQGSGFNPEYVRGEADTDSLGGRGIRLMRALTDRLLLYYDGNGMIVRLSKKRHMPDQGTS